jgi:hypothetical protein
MKALPIVLTASIVLLACLSLLGCLIGRPVDTASLALALPVLATVLGVLVGDRLSQQKLENQARADLDSGLADFEIWLRKERDAWLKRRVQISDHAASTGRLSSSSHAHEQADAFVQFAFAVDKEWQSLVERPLRKLLAATGRPTLKEVSPQLEQKHTEKANLREECLRQAREVIEKQLCEIDQSMACLFRQAVEERLGKGWLSTAPTTTSSAGPPQSTSSEA